MRKEAIRLGMRDSRAPIASIFGKMRWYGGLANATLFSGACWMQVHSSHSSVKRKGTRSTITSRKVIAMNKGGLLMNVQKRFLVGLPLVWVIGILGLTALLYFHTNSPVVFSTAILLTTVHGICRLYSHFSRANSDVVKRERLRIQHRWRYIWNARDRYTAITTYFSSSRIRAPV